MSSLDLAYAIAILEGKRFELGSEPVRRNRSMKKELELRCEKMSSLSRAILILNAEKIRDGGPKQDAEHIPTGKK